MAETKNPFMAIESKLSSPSDLKAGEQLFNQNCAACHGDQALGGPGGPSLHNRTFRRGGSDWAIFQTITLGLPNTAMSGRQLPHDDVWKLVSYLKRTIVAPPSDATLSESALDVSSFVPVAPAELKVAEDHPEEWLTYSGSYASHRY